MISAVCPEFVGAAVEAHVQNTTFCPELWDEINALCEDYRSRFTTVSIKEMAAIEATRRVYRAVAKTLRAIVLLLRHSSAVLFRARNSTRLTHSSTLSILQA